MGAKLDGSSIRRTAALEVNELVFCGLEGYAPFVSLLGRNLVGFLKNPDISKPLTTKGQDISIINKA